MILLYSVVTMERLTMTKCPECGSEHIQKNGIKKGKQNHICVECGRQFVKHNGITRGYSDEFRRECLKMYVNGMGFRAIERIKGVHHTTVITWVKSVGQLLPDSYKTLCYSKSEQMLRYSISLLIHYLKFGDVPILFT